MNTPRDRIAEDMITFAPSQWPRLMEVWDYAMSRGINLDEAVQELVNKGLSHIDRA